MAQIEADMKEKIEARNQKVDDVIDEFLEADPVDALSPDGFSEFEEPERTPEKKAVVEEKKEEAPPVKKQEEAPVKVKETPQKVEQSAPKEIEDPTPKESEKP